MLPFEVTIPATLPQGSEIPEGLMNNPVYCSLFISYTLKNKKLYSVLHVRYMGTRYQGRWRNLLPPSSASISYPEDKQNGLSKFSYPPAELHKVAYQYDRQNTNNVTPWRVRAIIVAVEKEWVLHHLCVCVCVCVCLRMFSLRYSACNAHAPYCHLWPAQLYTKFFHIVSQRYDFRKIYWT
jgi:hypothetical protein